MRHLSARTSAGSRSAWQVEKAVSDASPSARSSVPEVDLRHSSDPEGLIELGATVDIVGEDAPDDRAAGVHPVVAIVFATDLLVEHVEGPSIQAVLDDPER
jgi:hypothetical protein